MRRVPFLRFIILESEEETPLKKILHVFDTKITSRVMPNDVKSLILEVELYVLIFDVYNSKRSQNRL